MIRRPPGSTQLRTLFPYTTLFRSLRDVASAVLDRDGHPIAEREARLADGARGVAAPHVDLRRSLTNAHRQKHVTACAVECDDYSARRPLPPLLDECELFEVEHGASIRYWRGPSCRVLGHRRHPRRGMAVARARQRADARGSRS